MVPSKYRKNLGIGFLIFKWAKMARRERGLREASRDLGLPTEGFKLFILG